MSIKDFLKKQFIDVIPYTEAEDGILAARYPMADMEIQNGAKLTDAQVKVLEGQAKMFENSGFKVNTKEGITINAGPTRSLFAWFLRVAREKGG